MNSDTQMLPEHRFTPYALGQSGAQALEYIRRLLSLLP
jgi:hypothetical protein